MTQPAPHWPTSGAWGSQPPQPAQAWPAQQPGPQQPGPQWPGSPQPVAAPPEPRQGAATPIIVGLTGILAMVTCVFIVYLNYWQG